MAKSLQDYLLLVEKEYEYKIKIASEITESQFDAIESMMQKYDLLDVKAINRLPVQSSPLDFANIPPTEIYIIDVITRLPVATTVFPDEVSRCTDINISRIIVRGKNDPYEKELETIDQRQTTEYVTKIDDPEYKSDGIETQNVYGTEYNREAVEAIRSNSNVDPSFNKKEFNSKFKDAFNNFKKTKSVLHDIEDGPEVK